MSFDCRDRDITFAANPGRVTVSFAGRVIADSTRAVAVDEPGSPLRIYVPRDDVDASVLATSAHQTSCPYKGVASYFHLVSGDERAENAVWSYPDPCPLAEPVRGYLAFWGKAIRYDQHPH